MSNYQGYIKFCKACEDLGYTPMSEKEWEKELTSIFLERYIQMLEEAAGVKL